jgi:hypothetical protein
LPAVPVAAGAEDVVEDAALLVEDGDDEVVFVAMNKLSLFDPPQVSSEFPLQGILHPAEPSGAGPPPF